MGRINVVIDPADPDKNCTGCRMCEVICAFTHESVCNPAKSRIKVVSREPLVDVPVLCRQCKKPPCKAECPVNAITTEKNGVPVIDAEKCIGCQRCVEVCPFGAMTIHPDTGLPIVCDLCGGNPKCVEYCPTKILKVSRDASAFQRQKWAIKFAAPMLKAWGLEKTVNR